MLWYQKIKLRDQYDLHPVYKRVDTCAAEFATDTAYMYSTYLCMKIISLLITVMLFGRMVLQSAPMGFIA